jgi:hypothetical protein
MLRVAPPTSPFTSENAKFEPLGRRGANRIENSRFEIVERSSTEDKEAPLVAQQIANEPGHLDIQSRVAACYCAVDIDDDDSSEHGYRAHCQNATEARMPVRLNSPVDESWAKGTGMNASSDSHAPSLLAKPHLRSSIVGM